MKVAIYIRVSTEDQAKEGYSLAVQKEFLADFAKRQGHIIYKVYQDDGISGYTKNRPALARLLRDASQKKFSRVIVYKIDRFSRRLKDALSLVDELDHCGVAFESATEPFDTTTSAGKLTFQQLGSFAEFERNRIVERVFPGMVKGVQQGRWQGARYSPYGYRYNKEKKLLEVVPKEAGIVRMIYFMYLSGQSTLQIAGYLYKKGYKTRSGGRFHSKLVRDILKNKIYIGKLVWNRHHYDKNQKTLTGCRYVKNHPSKVVTGRGRHKPIVPQDDFDAVQIKLKHARQGFVRRTNSRNYPLTGLLFCAECGSRFQGCASVSKRVAGRTTEKRRYYRCSARQTHYEKCGNGYARADEIEAEIYKILEIMFTDDINGARFEGLMKNNSAEGSEETTKKLNDKKKELQINFRKQERLSGIYSEGYLAAEAYKSQIFPLRREETALKAEIKKIELGLIRREESEKYKKMLRDVSVHVGKAGTKPETTIHKWVLQLVFKSVIVEQGRIKSFELYEPFKSLYEGASIKCQAKERQEVMTIPESVSTSELSDVR